MYVSNTFNLKVILIILFLVSRCSSILSDKLFRKARLHVTYPACRSFPQGNNLVFDNNGALGVFSLIFSLFPIFEGKCVTGMRLHYIFFDRKSRLIVPRHTRGHDETMSTEKHHISKTFFEKEWVGEWASYQEWSWFSNDIFFLICYRYPWFLFKPVVSFVRRQVSHCS